jgi:hypothetical protein
VLRGRRACGEGFIDDAAESVGAEEEGSGVALVALRPRVEELLDEESARPSCLARGSWVHGLLLGPSCCGVGPAMGKDEGNVWE